MPQECRHRELYDVFDLSIREDEDLVGWSLDRVIGEQVLQKSESNLWFQLLFEHQIEDVVKDR